MDFGVRKTLALNPCFSSSPKLSGPQIRLFKLHFLHLKHGDDITYIPGWWRGGRETILITRASRTIKYLEINLIKEVKDLYTEHCKTWVKGTEEDKWKDPALVE